MVYVLKTKGANFRKIGSSRSPEKRLKELQTGCPLELEIEMLGKGSGREERLVHAAFFDCRSIFEWFVIPDNRIEDLRQLIDSLSAPKVDPAEHVVIANDSDADMNFWARIEDEGIKEDLPTSTNRMGHISQIFVPRHFRRHLRDEDANGGWSKAVQLYEGSGAAG